MPLAYSFLWRRVKKLLCFYTQWDRNEEKCGKITSVFVSLSNIFIGGVKQALITIYNTMAHPTNSIAFIFDFCNIL